MKTETLSNSLSGTHFWTHGSEIKQQPLLLLTVEGKYAYTSDDYDTWQFLEEASVED
jgi:hypothetical protein